MGSGGSIIFLVILVALSAFFSATETAFLSFNKARMKSLAKQGSKKAQLVVDLEERYDKLLSTILIGNNIVNILASSMATMIFVAFLGNAGVTVSTVVMTVVVLIFGEISPKTLAKDHADGLAMVIAPIINLLMGLFTPFTWLFSQWKKLLTVIFPSKEEAGMTEEELLTIVAEAEEEGGIDEQESDLIRSAIEFNDRTAEEILTHRVDVVAVDATSTMDEIEAVFLESGFSRLPVYEDNVDNIVGIVNAKDFHARKAGTTLKDIMRPALFVTTTSKTAALLETLQKSKSHLAIVTDEYGGTAGIVTMEDIIEELVGEIYDEHDEVIEEFKKLPDGSYQIECSADLAKMQELLNIPGEFDSATVSGWVIGQLERIPVVGDSFTFDNLTVSVTKVDSKRVLEINVVVAEPEEAKEE
ncbi:MAG: HlyC/CorC family transporter [Clostridia bacterium]|nr:HlyC/CorC family transporter [Clostridia bacterium]